MCHVHFELSIQRIQMATTHNSFISVYTRKSEHIHTHPIDISAFNLWTDCICHSVLIVMCRVFPISNKIRFIYKCRKRFRRHHVRLVYSESNDHSSTNRKMSTILSGQNCIFLPAIRQYFPSNHFTLSGQKLSNEAAIIFAQAGICHWLLIEPKCKFGQDRNSALRIADPMSSLFSIQVELCACHVHYSAILASWWAWAERRADGGLPTFRCNHGVHILHAVKMVGLFVAT